jgi:hypothetical protein
MDIILHIRKLKENRVKSIDFLAKIYALIWLIDYSLQVVLFFISLSCSRMSIF